MKSIPTEILVNIVRLLHQNDKLQCIQVCREWHSVIKSTVLFETLSISSKECLANVIASAKRKPTYGRQAGRYGDIPGIFRSRIWSNLTTLELFGGDNDAMDYLDSLINTPAVRHLKLNNMRLRMDDFEFIHNTLPLLKALTLLNIDYTSTRPLKDVVPASSVTSFQFFGPFTELPCRQMLLRYLGNESGTQSTNFIQ